jgi:hypothetical protein
VSLPSKVHTGLNHSNGPPCLKTFLSNRQPPR